MGKLIIHKRTDRKTNLAVCTRQIQARGHGEEAILDTSDNNKCEHNDAHFQSQRQDLDTRKGVIHCLANRWAQRYCRGQKTYRH